MSTRPTATFSLDELEGESSFESPSFESYAAFCRARESARAGYTRDEAARLDVDRNAPTVKP